MLRFGVASPITGIVVVLVARVFVDDVEFAALRAELAAEGVAVTTSQIADRFMTAWTWVLVVTVVLSAAWLLVLAFTYRGARWARVLLTVMGVLWILLALPSLGGQMYGGVATTVLSALNAVFVVATLAPLYTRPGREYFARPRFEIQQDR